MIHFWSKIRRAISLFHIERHSYNVVYRRHGIVTMPTSTVWNLLGYSCILFEYSCGLVKQAVERNFSISGTYLGTLQTLLVRLVGHGQISYMIPEKILYLALLVDKFSELDRCFQSF